MQQNAAIHIFPLKVCQGIFTNYCYVVMNRLNRSALIIDPAWEINKILALLEQQQVSLQAILLTHHHVDHVNLADALALHWRIPVYMSETEIHYYRFQCSNLSALKNEDKLSIGNITIKPIATPGHTKGSTCFFIENNLFTGDTLFCEGCGMCTGEGADPAQMFQSLRILKNNLLPNCKIYPGHSYGLPVGQTFQVVLQNNIYLSFEESADFIAYRMRKNQHGLLAFK